MIFKKTNPILKILLASFAFFILVSFISPTIVLSANGGGIADFKSSDYQELSPIPDKAGNLTESRDPIDYIQKLYYFALTMCVILAVVMIIIAGVQFTAYGASEEVLSDAKHRITYAIVGLLLALASWLILYIVNPKLVEGDLLLPSSLSGQRDTSGSGGPQVPYTNLIDYTIFQNDPRPTSEKILAAAKLALAQKIDTGCISGTDGGNLACAAVVSVILANATGDNSIGTLGTAEMYSKLTASPKFTLVPGGLSSAQPGDIVITPSYVDGNSVGHVGIKSETGFISNSSSKMTIHETSTWQREGWKTTYVFRAK